MDIKPDSTLSQLPELIDPTHGSEIDLVAEKKVVRKLDTWLAPLMALFVLVAYLDRSAIGNAAIAGMSEDLDLTGDRLNVAVTVFYVTYIAFGIPTSLCLKVARPSRLIPLLIIAWSAVVIGSAFVTNYAGLIATRLLLGAFESGLLPCLTIYISTFYRREEQARRISYLFVSAALSGAFGGLLAYGLTSIHGTRGLAGWRWLFLIEGAISMVVSIAAGLVLPDTFETAKWLSEDDKALLRARAENARIYHDSSNGFDKYQARLAFTDPKVWLFSGCQFFSNTCSFAFGTFLPVIIKGFGYSSVETQLLTVPVYIWASILYITTSYLSDRKARRAVFMIPMALITATGYALLLDISMDSPGALYFATFVTATGIYSIVGLNEAWVSNSNAGYHKRAAAIGMQQTIGNSSGIMAGQIYRLTAADGRYTIGHSVSIGAVLTAAIGYATLYVVLRQINRNRDGMSVEERARAIDAGMDGDRHPDFRYVL
ncbi:major facilitator superfamily transporter [Hypoxylon cercidicola]|nr:major facilitator superfamily transporter [Hypoxylon cercidicola]